MRKIKLNRYTVFYLLYGYFLIVSSFNPDYVAPIPYNATAIPVIAYSILVLFFILPFYFLCLVIYDLIKKRFKKTILNAIVVIVLFLVWQIIGRKVLKPHYEKHHLSEASQNNLVSFITGQATGQGQAQVIPADKNRVDFEAVKDYVEGNQ